MKRFAARRLATAAIAATASWASVSWIAAPAPAAEPGAAITWQAGKGADLLCVLDKRGESLCVYRYNAPAGRLELVAARSVKFDLQLEDLNGSAPTPEQVKARLAKEGRPVPAADDAAPAAVSAVALRVADDREVMCLIDSGRGRLCVYEFDVKQRRLRLAAARMLRYDFELQDFNNEGLSPGDIEKQLKKGQAGKAAGAGS